MPIERSVVLRRSQMYKGWKPMKPERKIFYVPLERKNKTVTAALVVDPAKDEIEVVYPGGIQKLKGPQINEAKLPIIKRPFRRPIDLRWTRPSEPSE